MIRKLVNFKWWHYSLISILVGALFLPGCKDEKPVIHDFGPSSEDFMQAYLTYTHSFFYVDGMLKSMIDSLGEHPGGVYVWKGIQVTVQPSTPQEFPKTFTMEFDSSHPNSFYKGIISGSVTASYVSEGSMVEFTFEECIFNHGRPTGSCSISNMGMVSGKTMFEFQIANGTLIKYFGTDTATSVLMEGSQDVLWAAGNNEITIPEGLITGQASDSLQFSAEVDKSYNLVKKAGCTYIMDGIFDYTVKNQNGDGIGNGVADFGYVSPSDCDQFVIIVVDGEVNRSEYIYNMDWIMP